MQTEAGKAMGDITAAIQRIRLNAPVETALNRAKSLQEVGKLSQAAQIYKIILQVQPNHAEALRLLGLVHDQQGEHKTALALIEQAIALKPNDANTHANRANALRGLNRFDEALVSYDRAIGIAPDHATAHNNRGIVLRDLKRFHEALASYDQAIALNPNYALAHYNRGNTLRQLNRAEEAIASFDRAIELNPQHASAHFNAGFCRLLLGDFGRGLPEYEWRWASEDAAPPRPELTKPLWIGQEDIAGRTILLHAEQGLGDTIQFSRYAARVAAAGARVILEVPGALKPLLLSRPGIDEVLARGEPLPDFEVHCPLLSLPLAFGTRLHTIPTADPYITASPGTVSAWGERLGPKTAPRIGLVWSGRPTHTNDHNRSIALSALRPLLKPGFSYFSLQKEVRAEDQAALQEMPAIRHFGDELQDFSDTAALTSLLDMVISVDTSVAHLAGAMGMPTWILLPEPPDWRWLLDRDDSPWYPTVRLFRRSLFCDWSLVIKDIGHALETAFPSVP